MGERQWFSPRDRASRMAFEALQERIGPLIADLFPDFRLTYCGFNRRPDDLRFVDGRDEIQITLHLLPLGESWAVEARLRAAAMPDLIAQPGGTQEGGV